MGSSRIFQMVTRTNGKPSKHLKSSWSGSFLLKEHECFAMFSPFLRLFFHFFHLDFHSADIDSSSKTKRHQSEMIQLCEDDFVAQIDENFLIEVVI